MKKIGILYICTGVYKVLWKEFYESAEKYLLPELEKHYYVFTDADAVDYEDENPRIHRIWQEAYPWPYATLKRFSIFLQCEEELKKFDYLFFFNADAQFVYPINQYMILPREYLGEELVVVRHAGYYNTSKLYYTYDRNPRSKAFIPFGRGNVYVCGGVNGGTAEGYLKMCRELSTRVEADLKNGIIAKWHDESHLNKYILEHRNYRLLSPEFTHPSQDWWVVPFDAIVVIRDKTKYFDLKKAKSYDRSTKIGIVERIYTKPFELYFRIKQKLKE